METMAGKLSCVSARKVAANRQNAIKSTGPKTPRGKAYSRRNAFQHGLFAIDQTIGWFLQFEDSDKYQELLQGLAESFQPVGAAEEVEVQNIAALVEAFTCLEIRKREHRWTTLREAERDKRAKKEGSGRYRVARQCSVGN